MIATPISKPWRITLDTNPDFCNLNCIMCEDHSPFTKTKTSKRPLMPRDLMEKVIREAAEMGITEIIPSTMGEPLLYPYFDDMLHLCHELGLTLNLTTNGTFPSREKHQNVEYWAERIIPIGSDVKISWNGSTTETQAKIMLGTCLEQHVENAKRFIAVRERIANESGHYCSLTMQLTFMKMNLDEIPDMVNIALTLGFDRIKGHQLWAHFDEIKSQFLLNDREGILQWNQIVNRCQDIIEKHNKYSTRKVKLDNFLELNLSQVHYMATDWECPFLDQEAWIDPNGRFNVCCAPDKQRESLGYFGNLNDIGLDFIWCSPAYRLLTETYKAQSLCQKCNMRRPKKDS